MDQFQNYRTLCRYFQEGRDYVIEVRHADSGFAVMAPHGGRIEPGTYVIAAAIAGKEHAYYAFQALLAKNNKQMHISSKRFDEPRAIELAQQAHTIITVHGCRATQPLLYIGGRDILLRDKLIQALQASGFQARPPLEDRFRGMHPNNLCNRGRRRRGVQLEISDQLRPELLNSSDRLQAFVKPIRSTLAAYAMSLLPTHHGCGCTISH